MAKTHFAISLFAAGVLFASCGGDDGAQNGTKGDSNTQTSAKAPAKDISAADKAEAEKHFNQFCATCHGKSGKGDGPAGANLNPKPRDWTSVEWQNSISDEKLAKTILEGGAAVDLSPLMPGSPQYKDRPGVIDALVEKVRSYGEK